MGIQDGVNQGREWWRRDSRYRIELKGIMVEMDAFPVNEWGRERIGKVVTVVKRGRDLARGYSRGK